MFGERDPSMIWWFGEPWGAYVNFECPQAPTPVDAECIFCDKPIRLGERGILMFSGGAERCPAHTSCMLANVSGRNEISEAWMDRRSSPPMTEMD